MIISATHIEAVGTAHLAGAILLIALPGAAAFVRELLTEHERPELPQQELPLTPPTLVTRGPNR